ncbi:flagellar hook protein FlgE [Yersinia enterocolitica]|nr:flagellar hook protein FlgE [Yersinia enterocolitica]
MTTAPAKLNVQGEGYNGANGLNFDLDLAGMTQQASATEMKSPSTTGYAPGQMNGYTIGDNGEVIASYSNGQRQTVGQILLSNFTNPGGLSSEGNNCWSETPASGQPTIGISGSGSLGKLYGNRLEASNVDLSQEMVNMIVFQRNYQSNSQTIRTQSELLQTLVNIS